MSKSLLLQAHARRSVGERSPLGSGRQDGGPGEGSLHRGDGRRGSGREGKGDEKRGRRTKERGYPGRDSQNKGRQVMGRREEREKEEDADGKDEAPDSKIFQAIRDPRISWRQNRLEDHVAGSGERRRRTSLGRTHGDFHPVNIHLPDILAQDACVYT